jgi:two-component system response regulator AtoC
MADILVIHDEAHLRHLLIDQIRAADHRVSAAPDVHQARTHAASHAVQYSIVLLGATRDERIQAAIAQVKREWPAAEVVVIGRSQDSDEASEAVSHGAYDYLAAPIEPNRLMRVLMGAATRWRSGADYRPRAIDPCPEDVTTVDPMMQAVIAKADRAAAVNSMVLLTGESGTGKEVFARRIHRMSDRRHFNFVPVNSGGLPEPLVESELFGYRKGAFTGAVSDSKGLIEEARGGVLFLDEIGDMPLGIQVRLLRFLDSGEIRAVGGTSIRHVDVRVIAATNRSLTSEIREKRFREDLFYRLSVVSLHLPPLRERRADIPALVQYHLRRIAQKLALPVPTVLDDVMSLLLRYNWPGNLRELRNALEHALVQAVDRVITPHDLPLSVQRGSVETIGGGTAAASLWAAEGHEALVSALRRHRNHGEAAAALGISRTTLWRRLRQMNSPPD